LGLWFWARYVLRGKAEVTKEPDLKVGNVVLKVVSYKYLIEVIDITNVAIIMSYGRFLANQGGTHEIPLKRCVQEVIDKLVGKIPKQIIQYKTSKVIVNLIAKNASKIQEKLKSIPGITGLEQTEKLGDEERYQFQHSGDLNILEKHLAEFGYNVTHISNTIYALPKAIKITIQNATMTNLKKLRDELKAEEITFLKGTITCYLNNDPLTVVETLEKIGSEITELTENSITCQPE